MTKNHYINIALRKCSIITDRHYLSPPVRGDQSVGLFLIPNS